MGSIFSSVYKLLRRKPAGNSEVTPTLPDPNIHSTTSESSLCFAPSVNMLFSINGNVKACCHNIENSLGKYPEQSIREIWDSKEAQAYRKQLMDHKFLSGCHVCATEYDAGQHQEMPATHFEVLPRLLQYPSMMEFLLSNTCNLECVMCTGYLSSSIRKNRDKLPPIGSPYDEAFVTQLEEFIPHLTETRFSGAGEAFSIGINYRIWEALITHNPKCLIMVQTNGTILNARVKDFLERGNFKIGVSLDSLEKEKFESIRINASFEQVMESIRYFAEYCHRHDKVYNISTCVMRSNWMEMPAFVSFCNSIGAHIVFHKVWSPARHSLYNLPAKELRDIYERLNTHICPSDTALERKNKRHYEYFVSVIKRWMEDAPDRERSTEQTEHMTVSALLQHVRSRLETHITTLGMPGQEEQELIDLCHSKVETVTMLWPTEAGKKKMLMTMAASRESDILAYVRDQPVEKLYEMSVATAEG